MSDKGGLRRWARTRPPIRDEESAPVIDALAAWLGDRPGVGVLTFLSMPGEVRVDRLVHVTPHEYFTTRTPESGDLTVHSIGAAREVHRLGFEQPVKGSPEVGLEEVGVVLVPGLCFDRAGNRLGRGGGHYDRLLARMPWSYPIGVTVERFVVDLVPAEPHDVPMLAIATERGVMEVRPSA